MPARRLEEKAQEYLEWLLTPPGHRDPKGKLAMAEKLGVAFKTLYNWERSDWFVAEIRKAKGPLLASWYGDIVGRMKQIIDDGSDRDAIAAARVLLPHLEFPEDEGTQADSLEALKTALIAAGVKIVDA